MADSPQDKQLQGTPDRPVSLQEELSIVDSISKNVDSIIGNMTREQINARRELAELQFKTVQLLRWPMFLLYMTIILVTAAIIGYLLYRDQFESVVTLIQGAAALLGTFAGAYFWGKNR